MCTGLASALWTAEEEVATSLITVLKFVRVCTNDWCNHVKSLPRARLSDRLASQIYQGVLRRCSVPMSETSSGTLDL